MDLDMQHRSGKKIVIFVHFNSFSIFQTKMPKFKFSNRILHITPRQVIKFGFQIAGYPINFYVSVAECFLCLIFQILIFPFFKAFLRNCDFKYWSMSLKLLITAWRNDSNDTIIRVLIWRFRVVRSLYAKSNYPDRILRSLTGCSFITNKPSAFYTSGNRFCPSYRHVWESHDLLADLNQIGQL